MSEKFGTSVIIIVLIMVVGSVGNVQAALVGQWKLDETSGTIAHDSSGNGHHATLMGGLSFDKSSVGGIEGRALKLDGIDDGLVTADSFCRGSDSFTIALWFNPKKTQT